MNTTEWVLEVHKAVSSVQAGRHSNPTVATIAEARRRIIIEWDLTADMIKPELHNVFSAQTSVRNEALISDHLNLPRGNHNRRSARG